ncbi:cysteine--1-D-myo-inosityl 2-amino-2-deoxy-alpha-D-glucopyranoside ligase [Saxibacter everestensis]|uniref:L-cysteine:1D-myo-inositol 2-amino-2-deoxy-alpha-D-glucopyranoside ligase n=1 Tax=Saxibacter everestensis TaxID=2909229 RepID=A0ABY8QZF7_9MICO|nr:cysteine--1-D-myo-inosityl 2-amino-2-deoxy-alpha-D-glucopyranoside ligase [Brevibacteriaceae bacterium ZFBP1038]
MKSWARPSIPQLPGHNDIPRLYDTPSRRLLPVPSAQDGDQGTANLYVCGITPYDATHLGHAATYVAFDTLQRVWLDAGLDVRYVQNITDVDDPLLERANETGVDWRDLAESQIELFRTDMTALRALPPNDYIGAVESIPLVTDAVERLVGNGAAYRLDNGDVYYRVTTDTKPAFGEISGYDHDTMTKLFAERGGDPDTPGKEDPLDSLLWRAARDGEPFWPGGTLGDGRPGWHIECAAIALKYLGTPIDVQGGGSDLKFPHHEMCAASAAALTGVPFADAYVHTGMVGLDGEKMSKSLGNLVLVSQLLKDGIDPGAIRLVLLAHHYRSDWTFTPAALDEANGRLDRWADAVRRPHAAPATDVLAAVRSALADDLDTPAALSAVDRWAATDGDDAGSPALVRDLVDALFGVALRSSTA